MIIQLYKWFIKDYQEVNRPIVRERYGKLAGIVGIISNTFLFILKILIGTIFNSISITADAVNNLSDAGSSIITLVGFKLSGKPADEKHPYGHTRAEYITGFIVSLVVVLLGIEFIKSSYQKIINPDPINFSYLTVIVLVASILVKLWQSYFNKITGIRINSTALVATSMDSRNDVITTSTVLAATVFAKITGFQIDGYMGIGVALFIIYSGYKLIRDTMDPLLGLAPSSELVNDLEKRILSYDGVLGLHDLVVHSYGPEKSYASVHVEVAAHQDLLESLMSHYRPKTPIEEILVKRIALLDWRLHNIHLAEKKAMHAGPGMVYSLPPAGALERILKYERTTDRELHRTIAQLERITHSAKKSTNEPED
jgi:cation diffusion facilitator family transporter